jgi:hypothetical protein
MALAIALGLFSVERPTAATDAETCDSTTDDSEKRSAGFVAPRFNPQDVRWLKAMGIEPE